jgi:hypothetical protein
MRNTKIIKMKMKGGKVFTNKIKTCLRCFKVQTSKIRGRVKIQ